MLERIPELGRRAPGWVALAGALAICLFAYAPSLVYPYVQDAVAAVARNPVVGRGDIVEIFRSDYWKDTISNARTLYRPVTVLTFAGERVLAGAPSPMLSHVLNVALHCACALLLFAWARRLGARRGHAWIACWGFAAHPVMLQGVINVVGRADELALLFGLLALLALSRTGAWPGAPDPSPGARRVAAWSAGLFLFLALGSKEVAAAFPVLALAQETLFRRRAWSDGRGRIERATALAPCVLAALVWLHLRILALGTFPGLQVVPHEDNVLVGLAGWPRLATALAMAARYAGLLLWPAGLSPDYSGAAIGVHDSLVEFLPLAGLLFLGGIAVLLVGPWLGRNRAARSPGEAGPWPAVSMGACLFLAPYALVGNLLVLNAAGFAERLLYVPAAGLFLAGAALPAWALRRWPRLRPVMWTGVVVLLVSCVAQVRDEGSMWASQRALWDHARASQPRSLRASTALAHRQRRQGNTAEAERIFRRTAELSPEDPGAWSDLGIFLASAGDLGEAETALRRSVMLDPTRGEAWAALGRVLARTGRRDEATRDLRRALLWRPDLVSAAADLGRLLYAQGHYAEAARYFRGCVALGRSDLVDELRRAEAMAGPG